MNIFPTTFTNKPEILIANEHSADDANAIQHLNAKGFYIQLGLTTQDVQALSQLSLQQSIRKFCPNDCTERFKDIPTTNKWLNKERQVMLLNNTFDHKLAGVAWVGPGTSPHIPSGSLTGGIRISETFQGRGLAAPFLMVILNYTSKLMPGSLLWFECWQSNSGAVHTYEKLGFEIIDTEQCQRPNPDGTQDPDVRLYMSLRI